MPELARAAIALPIIFAVAGLLLLVHELGHYIAARACGRPVRLVAIGFGPKLIEWVDRRGTSGASPSSRSAATSRYARTPCKPTTLISVRSGPGPACCHGRWSGCQPDPRRHPLRRPCRSNRRDRLCAGRQLHRTREPGRNCGFPAGRSDHRGRRHARRALRRSPPHPGEPPEPCRTLRGYPESRDAGADVTLAPHDQDGRTIGHLGIWSHELRTRHVGIREAVLLGVQRSWQGAVATVADVARAIRTAGRPNPLATAIDVAGLKGPASAPGFPPLLALTAFLSVGLALTNLLPMPMLDGGAILVALAELIRRRPASPAALAFANRAGAAALASLFAAASLHDLFAR